MTAVSPFQFTASMASALAWPIVVGAVLLAFRRELRRWLADRPASIKMGAFAVEWERRSAQIAVGLAESGVSASNGPDISAPVAARLTETSGPSPVQVIKTALAKIERLLRMALVAVGVQRAEQETLPRLADLAVQRGLIAQGNADSVMGVAVMANLALVKPWKITESEVNEFLALAEATLFGVDLAIRTGVRQPTPVAADALATDGR